MKLALAALCLLLSMLTRPAHGHELRPGALGLYELERGRFAVKWSPPDLLQGASVAAKPRFPEHCELVGERLDCGARGLSGLVAVPALEGTLSRVVLHVRTLDGNSTTAVLSAESTEVVLGTRVASQSKAEMIGAYTVLGVEHILSGYDHLLFVLGLMLLVRLGRRLILTVTAFTLAHSLTLCAAALGVTRIPAGPVEAVIALSILLLAVECARKDESLSRRMPWAVALSFGLLHGFGFAGALTEIGLPPDHVPLALLCFNVGVELGQLLVIALCYLIARSVLRRWPVAGGLERPLVYGMGALAAFWSIERTWVTFQ